MALAADCFAGSSGIDSPVGTVVVTQSCDCLSPCFATGIAGKGFYTLISTGRLSGNCTIIPGMTGSRNFSYIYFAVTACAVMALAADCFAGSSGINGPVGTVVVTQGCDCLSPCFATGIAGKGFYTLISTGRLSGNCTIIPGMTGSRNFSYIYFAVTACAVMALAADCFAGSSGIDSPVGTVIVT